MRALEVKIPRYIKEEDHWLVEYTTATGEGFFKRSTKQEAYDIYCQITSPKEERYEVL